MKIVPLTKELVDTLNKSMTQDTSEPEPVVEKTFTETFLDANREQLTDQQKRNLESIAAREKYVPQSGSVLVTSEWSNGKWFTAEYRKHRRSQIAKVKIVSFMDKIRAKAKLAIDDEIFDVMLDTGNEDMARKIVLERAIEKRRLENETPTHSNQPPDYV